MVGEDRSADPDRAAGPTAPLLHRGSSNDSERSDGFTTDHKLADCLLYLETIAQRLWSLHASITRSGLGKGSRLHLYSDNLLLVAGGNDGGSPGPGTFGVIARIWM